jgi:hypothetical protein
MREESQAQVHLRPLCSAQLEQASGVGKVEPVDELGRKVSAEREEG